MTTDPQIDPQEPTPPPAEPGMWQIGGHAPFQLPNPVIEPPRRSRIAAVGALLGAFGMVAGGVFAVRSLAGPEGNSPSDAVRQMTKAVAAGDAIGAMEALAPGERDVMLQSGVPLLEQLKRLDILKSDLDLSAVKGAGVSFDGQTYTEVPVRTDIVNVNVRGGTYRLSADTANLPIGGWLRKLAGDSLDGQGAISQEKPVAGQGATLTTIKDGDRWYVSLGFTLAEQARSSAGKAMPALGAGIPARGEDTPEGAVRSMLAAAAALDVRRVIELLPPDEMGALHAYAPLFIADAQQLTDEAAKNYSLSFPNLGLSVDGSGDTAHVRITRWSADLRLKSAEGGDVKVLLDGDCVTATLEGDTKRRCGTEVPQLLVDFGLVDQASTADVSKQLGNALKNPSADGAMTVVRHGGRWYVSPTRTLLDSATFRLAKVRAGDLDKLKDQYTKLLDDTVGGGVPTLGS